MIALFTTSLRGSYSLEGKSYFGSSQISARLFCFMQSFNNFSLIYVQTNHLNWIEFPFHPIWCWISWDRSLRRPITTELPRQFNPAYLH